MEPPAAYQSQPSGSFDFESAVVWICSRNRELTMQSNLLSGAKILLNCLARENVECIFGYPGGVTLPLYDALYDYPIRHVLVRHEQNAVFAAEGFARSTGKVGVCCATSGPGA